MIIPAATRCGRPAAGLAVGVAALLLASCLVPAPRGYGLAHPEPPRVTECREVLRATAEPACKLLCEGPPEPRVPTVGFLVSFDGPDGDTCICVQERKPDELIFHWEPR